MNSAKTMLVTYARALWRRRWYAAAVAWVVCLAGWAFVVQLPNQYEAKARIYVDTDSMLRPLMRGIAVDSNILSQVDLMQRTLLSRPNLQKVSHMADLDLYARSQTDMEEIITTLRQRVILSGEGHNLFSLAYTGPNREQAAKVVQSLLTVFVESNLGNSRKDLLSARNFIDEQLRLYTQQLDEAEKKIADFKAKYVGALPGENSFVAKLDNARVDLEKTKAELEEAKQKRDELTRQLASVPKYIDSYTAGPDAFGAGPPLGGGAEPGGDSGSARAAARVVDLEQKLKTLLETYTELHPDVVRTKRLLEQAREEAKAAQKPAKAAQGDGPNVSPRATRNTSPNPVYEQLQLTLVSMETAIASLEARARRAQGEVERWEKAAKSVPEVGADMSKLTRDYDVIKRAYDELLNRRESAKIGSDLENQTQTVQFRIVDPPEAPSRPVAPKRILLLSVVLLGGILSGAAFSFLLAQVDDSVMTVRQLKEIVSLPVLGAISVVSMASKVRRRAIGTVSFIMICIGLVVTFIGIVSVEAVLGLRA